MSEHADDRQRPSRRRAKVLWPLAVLALGVALAAALVMFRPRVERAPEPPPAPLVRTVEAQRSAKRIGVESQGTIVPRTRSTLSTQVAGRVEWVSPRFAEGAFFDVGEVLVRLDADDYRLAARQAEAAVAQAQVRLAQEQAEAAVAREEWRDLGRGKPNPLVLREPQLAEARAALEAARANLEQARLNQRRTEIRAPYAGRIQERRADLGQFVAAGAALADIYATDAVEVRLPVQEKDLAFLPVELGAARRSGKGPPVTLRGDVAGRTHAWQGEIVRVAAGLDPKTRLLDLFARVDDPFNRARKAAHTAPLPVGLFVEATIRGRTLEDVYVLPRAALREGRRVLIVDEAGRLQFRDVEVARTEAEHVVVGSGVRPGDQVVVSALETPVEGMQVKTMPLEGEPLAAQPATGRP